MAFVRTQAHRIKMFGITIAESSGAISSVYDLVTGLTNADMARIVDWKIMMKAGATPAMAAFNWSTTAAHTAAQVVQNKADTVYNGDCGAQGLRDIYVRAYADTEIVAVLVVYLKK